MKKNIIIVIISLLMIGCSSITSTLSLNQDAFDYMETGLRLCDQAQRSIDYSYKRRRYEKYLEYKEKAMARDPNIINYKGFLGKNNLSKKICECEKSVGAFLAKKEAEKEKKIKFQREQYIKLAEENRKKEQKAEEQKSPPEKEFAPSIELLKILPQQKIDSVIKCLKDKKLFKEGCLPSEECLSVIAECSNACRSFLSEDCIYKVFNEDILCWLNDDDESLFGLIENKFNNKIPDELLQLKGIKFFEKKIVLQKCIDKVLKYPVCVYSFFMHDINNWLDGKKSIYRRIIKEKLNEFQNFQSSEGYKKTKWGINRKQIQVLYPKFKKDQDGDLYIEDIIAKEKAKIYFTFIYDKLVEINILFIETYLNPDRFVKDYNEFQKLLIKKYGQPTVSESCKDEKSLVDAMYLAAGGSGRAIRGGRCTLFSKWETEKTKIEHILSGLNLEIYHFIHYKSKELAEIKKRYIERQKVNDL